MRKVKKKENTKNTSQIEYTGNVTIKVERNGEVVQVIDGHNSGTYRLFEFIAKCLAGLYESSYGPKYIQCFHSTSATPDLSSLTSLSGVIPVGTTTYETPTNTQSIAKLTFTIPGVVFPDGVVVNYFALYNYKDYNNQANPMATYYLSTGLSGLDRNSNIIVVWELKIGNATN